jgi:hypothetical protein
MNDMRIPARLLASLRRTVFALTNLSALPATTGCALGSLLSAGMISPDDLAMSSGVSCDQAIDGTSRCNLF